MSIWLLVSPAVMWLTVGLLGLWLLRWPPARLWAALQLTTEKKPFEPGRFAHRAFAVQMKVVGLIAILGCIFITVMSLLVAVGIIPPAHQ